MFYIIASRIPLVYSDPTNRKFLKIFVIGSLLYICIHYYLYLETRSNIIEKIKSKLLFVMAGDFLIACTLAKFLSPVIPVAADNDVEEKETDKPKYLANEKERIMRELEERRKTEMLKAQQVAQQQAILAQQQAAQAALAQQQASQQVAQKASQSAQVKIQEAAAKEKAEKSKVKSKSKKKDDTTTSSSSSSSSSKSSESEKPKKTKKTKKDKHSSEEEDTEMPVYE